MAFAHFVTTMYCSARRFAVVCFLYFSRQFCLDNFDFSLPSSLIVYIGRTFLRVAWAVATVPSVVSICTVYVVFVLVFFFVSFLFYLCFVATDMSVNKDIYIYCQ